MKYKIGMALIILGIISPLIGFIVPFLGFDSTTSTALVAFFMVGGPEIFLIAGGALAGKEGLDLIKSKLFAPAGQTRYKFGAYLLIFGVLANMIFAYLNLMDFYTISSDSELTITIVFDVLAVVGILLMGKEFFGKLSKLLTYEGVATPQTK